MFPKLTAFDVVKIFFRALFTLLVISVFVLLFWRMSAARVPEHLKTLTPNDTLLAAYEQKGEALTTLTQQQNTITRTEENYGYFAVSGATFIPAAKQLQLLVRYNDSTLEALKTDYELDFTPESDKDWYDVTVVLAIDKTPEDKTDNLASAPESVELVRLAPSALVASEHKGRHSYRKLIFDGVPIEDETLLAVYVDFYYIDDVAYQNENFNIYEDKAYGTLCLYAYTEAADNVIKPITQKDKKALEKND